MELSMRFTEDDWLRIERDWSAWWAGELERPMVFLEGVEHQDAYDPHYAGVFLGNYPLESDVNPILDEFVARLNNTHYLGDSFPRFWPNFGPGITAAFAGATVHSSWDTMWFMPGSQVSPPDMTVRADWQNPWWLRVVEFTRAALQRWGADCSIGLTDLGGNLDILASLLGTEQLLEGLVVYPDEIDRLVSETTAMWLECFDRLDALIAPAGRGCTCWGPLWASGRGYMLQSDFSYMISPRMFQRFVVPDLEACCAAMEHAFYHLDGVGELVHLDALLSIPRLRGIQWVPGTGKPPSEAWLPELDKIRKAGKLCQVVVTTEGALTIMRELGGKGFCFNISEPTLTPEEGEAFLEQLNRDR